jgi:hypothetical protein
VGWQAPKDFDTIREVLERYLHLASGWKGSELVGIIGHGFRTAVPFGFAHQKIVGNLSMRWVSWLKLSRI